jgi:hypothetical protein
MIAKDREAEDPSAINRGLKLAKEKKTVLEVFSAVSSTVFFTVSLHERTRLEAIINDRPFAPFQDARSRSTEDPKVSMTLYGSFIMLLSQEHSSTECSTALYDANYDGAPFLFRRFLQNIFRRPFLACHR